MKAFIKVAWGLGEQDFTSASPAPLQHCKQRSPPLLQLPGAGAGITPSIHRLVSALSWFGAMFKITDSLQ
jgi:hypothetical protein